MQLGWKTLGQVSQLSSFPFLPHTMQTLSIVFCKEQKVIVACLLRCDIPYSDTRNRTSLLPERFPFWV